MRAIAAFISLLLVLSACVQTTVTDDTPAGTDVIVEEEIPARTQVVYEAEPETVVIYEQQDAGRAVFAITDRPVSMGEIHELWITVERVEVQAQGGGWITVSEEEHRYDVLQLREEQEQGILADVVLEPGTYQQVRLTISEVEIIDDDGEHVAVLPSDTLRFTAPFTIADDQVTYVVFDFDLSRSLHLTGNGRYVLTPVIRVLVYTDAALRILATERIVVQEGEPREIVVVGTDVEGNVGRTILVPGEVNIEIRGQDRIVVVNNTRETIVNNTIIVDRDDGDVRTNTSANATGRTNRTLND